eukprot:TRINITY_DN31504_c0_g1_i1.p2 TRINITY_DN31504_c0_g1~~TRINITY_DN31504_c0_g1_i1.p2  ORF type:complete len:372 (+),score=71.16 TRINITY_DN31504_c0_g1_i1:318-1433(+)
MSGKGNQRDSGVLKASLKTAASKSAQVGERSSKSQTEDMFSSPAGSPTIADAGDAHMYSNGLPEVPPLPESHAEEEELLLHQPSSGPSMADLLKEARGEIIQSTNTSIDSLLSEYDRTNSARHLRHEATARQHAVEIKHIDNRVNQHEKRINDIEKRLEIQVKSATLREVERATEWDSPPDETSIRINLEGLASRSAVVALVKQWMDDAPYNEDEHFKIPHSYQPLAKHWVVQFTAEPITAARQVKKALQLLNKEGVFTQLHVTAPDDTKVKAFASRDKNEKTKKTEVLTKCLLAGAKAVHPTQDWRALKGDGVVAIGWSRIIKVEPAQDGSYTLWWDSAFMEEFKLSNHGVESNFRELAAGSAATSNWLF